MVPMSGRVEPSVDGYRPNVVPSVSKVVGRSVYPEVVASGRIVYSVRLSVVVPRPIVVAESYRGLPGPDHFAVVVSSDSVVVAKVVVSKAVGAVPG